MTLLEEIMSGIQPDLPYVAPYADEARQAAAARMMAANRRKDAPRLPAGPGLLQSASAGDWGATPDAYMGPPAPAQPSPSATAGDWGADPSTAFGLAPQPGSAPDLPPPVEVAAVPGGLPAPPPAAGGGSGITEASARRAAPAAPAAPAYPEQSFAQGLMERLRDNQSTLFALAGGFAGARTLGDGARRAFSAAAPASATDRQLSTRSKGAKETYQALIARGVPANEALSASQNPAMLQAVIKKYMSDGELKEINGRLVRVNGDKVSELANYSEDAKPRPGYQWIDPNDRSKGQTHIPGGDEDPDTILRKANASRDPTKATKITVNDVEKMSADGQKIQQVTGFANTFKPEYANYKADMIGDAANLGGRTGILPGYKDQANWWQSYQSHKNMIRNAQFGSALTATEAAEFQKADISPGMDPEIIKRNLARQQSIIRNNIGRKASALIEAGYDKNAVLKGYGISEADLAASTPSGGIGVGGSTTINGVTIKRLN